MSKHGAPGRVVDLDEGRVLGSIPVRPGANEVDERHAEDVRIAQPRIEVVVDRPVLIAVEDPVCSALVLVALLGEGAVDRERGGPALHSGAVDAIGAVEERHRPAAKRKSWGERTVRKFRAMLRVQDVKGSETRTPHVVVAHRLILRQHLFVPREADAALKPNTLSVTAGGRRNEVCSRRRAASQSETSVVAPRRSCLSSNAALRDLTPRLT
jgi:hypothetical protein